MTKCQGYGDLVPYNLSCLGLLDPLELWHQSPVPSNLKISVPCISDVREVDSLAQTETKTRVVEGLAWCTAAIDSLGHPLALEAITMMAKILSTRLPTIPAPLVPPVRPTPLTVKGKY
ncbi:uncharacterized protein LOC113468562 [Diaphorina citri]|uniref:Uncharacterized protein LOC113468562 n=1 Tax=Diaphorina citri TaxID=121845 RepID=A0A3Q0J3U4_DIACI|nr:uncharacterized protein LOC113468562 [Diaphorina citri]